ncbi:hypothetical protein FRC07_012993 [Ceratobasidium sp. 392]|nr:hypothetical protein FRC07_012993 [Ceratobasidium sp. 392]
MQLRWPGPSDTFSLYTPKLRGLVLALAHPGVQLCANGRTNAPPFTFAHPRTKSSEDPRLAVLYTPQSPPGSREAVRGCMTGALD